MNRYPRVYTGTKKRRSDLGGSRAPYALKDPIVDCTKCNGKVAA